MTPLCVPLHWKGFITTKAGAEAIGYQWLAATEGAYDSVCVTYCDVDGSPHWVLVEG